MSDVEVENDWHLYKNQLTLLEQGKVDWVDKQPCCRFRHDWPAGITAYIGYGVCADVRVAGISQPERIQAALDFLNGYKATVCLEREPNNVRDPNAIRVIVSWSDRRGVRHSSQVGYVPKETAKQIKKLHPVGLLGARLRTAYLPTVDRSIGLKIDIGRPPIAKRVVPSSSKQRKRSRKTQITPSLTAAEMDMVFESARLANVRPSFQRQVLRDAVLCGCDLSGFDFNCCDLSGANLERCDLSGANLFKANLTAATLTDANLTDANLEGARMNDCNLTGCRFVRANFKRAKLAGSRLERAAFNYAVLNSADLSDCEGQDADFSNATMIKAKVRDATFCEARFHNADLSAADFTKSELCAAIFKGAILNGTKFWQSNLCSTDLRSCDLSHAKLRGAWKEDTLTDDGYLYSDDHARRNSPVYQKEKEARDLTTLLSSLGLSSRQRKCNYCGASYYDLSKCPNCGRITFLNSC